MSKENFKHPSKIQKYIVIGGLVVIPMTMKGLTRISQLLCLGNPIEQHKNIIKFQNTVQNLMAFFSVFKQIYVIGSKIRVQLKLLKAQITQVNLVCNPEI